MHYEAIRSLAPMHLVLSNLYSTQYASSGHLPNRDSSYLVWQDGKARVLIDVGGGSSDNFGRSGAEMEDLDAILFSHFHVDHSADLPALIKSSFFDNRRRDLPVFGPSGSHWMPDTTNFLESLFDIEGAFRYLAALMDDGRSNGYRLQPKGK